MKMLPEPEEKKVDGNVIAKVLGCYNYIVEEHLKAFNNINKILAYLDGIKIDCPEKECKIIIQDVIEKSKEKMNVIKNELDNMNKGLQKKE